MIHRLSVTLIAIGLTAVLAVPFSTTPAQAASVTPAIDPSWVRWDAGTKMAYLTIIAGYKSVAGGFTFNGYGQGRLTITVPVGAKVVIAFTNQSSSPHSAVITPFAKHTLAADFAPAFPGAASPNAGNGVAHLTRPQTFSFHASTAGTYALVCGVPGHALAGMWDVFRVATVDRPAMRTTRAAAATEQSGGQHKGRRVMTGSAEGVVRDATSGRPIAHAYAILGWTTFKRVGETDAYRHYSIDHV